MNILIKNYLKIIARSIIDFWHSKKIFLIFWIFFILLFQWAIIFASYYWFDYIVNNFPWWYIFAPQILWIIISTTFILMFFAGIIATISTCFKNDEVKFLLHTAFEYKDIYAYSFLKVVIFASLWVIIFLLPIFIGFWLSNSYTLEYYLLIFFLIFATVWISVFLGNIFFVFIIKYILKLNKKIIKWIIFSVIALILFLSFQISRIFDLAESEQETIFEEYIYSIEFNNLLLPWNWINTSLQSYIDWSYNLLILWIIFLFITSILIFQIILYIGKNHFIKAYNTFEQFSLSNKNIKDKITLFNKNKYINLFIKDLLLYLKDSSWWMQFLMLAVLVWIYLIILNWINTQELQTAFAATAITIWNIAMTWFLISAIALKFIYPNISIEWKSFWVLKTLPISLLSIYIIKLIFFLILFLVITYIISISYSNIVWMDTVSSQVISILIFAVSVFIVSFYFALGNAYPNFFETNSSQISTSVPWLLWVIVSNIVILSIAWLWYIYFLEYYGIIIECNELGLWFFSQLIIMAYTLCISLSILVSIWWYKNFKKLST